MSDDTHTPGPWIAGDPAWFRGRTNPGDGKRPITAGDCGVVANVYGAANARLVAAAPDLLAALKALRLDANRLCDRNLGGTYKEDCRRAIALADAALAKAEGGPR